MTTFVYEPVVYIPSTVVTQIGGEAMQFEHFIKFRLLLQIRSQNPIFVAYCLEKIQFCEGE